MTTSLEFLQDIWWRTLEWWSYVTLLTALTRRKCDKWSDNIIPAYTTPPVFIVRIYPRSKYSKISYSMDYEPRHDCSLQVHFILCLYGCIASPQQCFWLTMRASLPHAVSTSGTLSLSQKGCFLEAGGQCNHHSVPGA